MTRETHDNEDDELSFISIAAATANVIRYLQIDEKQQEERDNNTPCPNEGKERPVENREYVEQRLRDYAAFERRSTKKD